MRKLERKAPLRFEIVHKKINEITRNPHHYKPLRGGLHGTRRAHINSSFVLTFEIYEERRQVMFLAIEHHDVAYEK